jgi:hypothetical protein
MSRHVGKAMRQLQNLQSGVRGHIEDALHGDADDVGTDDDDDDTTVPATASRPPATGR